MCMSSPILKLNHDILLTILRMNANMFEKEANSALWYTQNASQVCHSWRELTLTSPSLWARLMDFDYFRWQGTDSWAKEVLRRAGSASMWIRTTDVQLYPKHTRNFFFQVLRNSWDQIQILKVTMAAEKTTPQQWDALYRNAPRLIELDLSLSGFDKIQASQNRPLFNNHAPSLLRFKAEYYKFSSQAPWLANLCSITIEAKFTLHELLDAVKVMTQLEFLRIDRILNRYAATDVSQNLPTAQLSKLNHIRILLSDLRAGAIFIRRLEVPSNCSLFFGCTHISKDDMAKNILKDSFQGLAQFVERYLEFYGTTKISVACDPKTVSFKDEPYSEAQNYIEVSLSSTTGWPTEPFLHYVHDIFFETFSFSCLKKVTVLGTKCLYPPSDLLATFISYLRAVLPSLQTFDTDERTIRYILDVQEESLGLIMPELHTVMLDLMLPSYFQDSSPIFDFLNSRRNAGKPVKVLDLTKCNSDVGERMSFLEELTGLRIMWTKWGVEDVLEYVCGAGHPEKPPY